MENRDMRNAPDEERGQELYTIPSEGSCSPEFPEGCVIRE